MVDRIRNGYSGVQIGLHWLIAALVLFQLVFGESMSIATRAVRRETEVPPSDAALASAHYWVGISVLALVLIRLALRLIQGVPEASGEPGSLPQRLATAAHWLFYALLVLVPVTGLLAVYVSPQIGNIHELGKPAFIVLITLHALAAFWHQFWLRDGTLKRMLVPAP